MSVWRPSRFRNVGFVSTRIAGTDGVSLEIDKWVMLGYSYGGFLAQFYTVNHPENVAGLILVGASTGMHVDTGSSRQRKFMSEEEKSRLKEIRKELLKLSKEKELQRKTRTIDAVQQFS